MLEDGVTHIRTGNNGHNFSILGDNMKPRTALILIMFCFIAAGTIDQQEAEQKQLIIQGE